ncbi:MAG: hypothetical protein M1834_005538 [Cirrosporium novae-zelandiae]|nr:MAG: hypothetical protein M1834_005538 [Cirrosporium novae-zelandiae]
MATEHGLQVRPISSNAITFEKPYCYILRMPSEILDMIVDHIDIEPPSIRNFYEATTHKATQSECQDIKNLSFTCRVLRAIALPQLFRALRIEFGDISKVFENLHLFNVHRRYKVRSICLTFPTHQNILPFPITNKSLAERNLIPNLCRQVFRNSKERVFTVVGSSAELAFITGISLDYTTTDFLCHSMTQYMQFRSSDKVTLDIELQKSSGQPFPISLLNVFPWTSFYINEGNFAPEYTMYEHYLRRPPSILVTMVIGFHRYYSDSRYNLTNPIPFIFFSLLRTFSYTAVFPLSIQVEAVSRLASMLPNLKKFELQLAPTPSERSMWRGCKSIDPHDLWTEFEMSYVYIFTRLKVCLKPPGTAAILPSDSENYLRLATDIQEIRFRDNVESEARATIQGLRCPFDYMQNMKRCLPLEDGRWARYDTLKPSTNRDKGSGDQLWVM